MAHNPHSTDRAHHLKHLVDAHQHGKPWYRIADIYRHGLMIRPERADYGVGRFLDLIGRDTGWTPFDLMRAVATLERVEFFAAGRSLDGLLGDDLETVELATRYAWHDPAKAIEVLTGVADGSIPRQAVKLLILGAETDDEMSPPGRRP